MSCGTRAQHFRPGDPDGARLLRSSLLINCLVLLVIRTAGGLSERHLRQPAPSPVLRLLWLRTPLPNRPARAPAADAFTEEPLTTHCWSCDLHLRVLHLHQLRSCSRRPLITVGHPVRSSVPSPSCNNPGFGTPPPHRPAVLQLRTTARQFVSAGPCSISATRETITTPPPNVYSGQHRFPCTRQRDNRPRTAMGRRQDRERSPHPVARGHRLRPGDGVTGDPPKDQVLSVNGSARTAVSAAHRRPPALLANELTAERVDRGAHRLGVVPLRVTLAGGRTPGPHHALRRLRYRLRHREHPAQRGQRATQKRAVTQEADQGVRPAGILTQLPRDTRACSGARIRAEGAGGCGDSRSSRRPATVRLGRPGGAMGRGQLPERLTDRWPNGQQLNAARLHQ